MHFTRLALSTITTLPFVAALPVSTCASDVFTSSAYNATVFSLIYGIPLLAYSGLSAAVYAQVGTNALATEGLATPAARSFVKPNVDTLYASAVIDLSHHDVEVYVPPIELGRYYSVVFYDPYGDVYANVGSVSKNLPGHYLLTSSKVRTSPNTLNHTTRYQGIIESPTTYGTLVIRILVRNNGSDVEYVQGLQKQFQVKGVGKECVEDCPAHSISAATFNVTHDSIAEEILGLTAVFAPSDVPRALCEQATVTRELLAAGISVYTYHPQAGVNLTLATIDARREINAAVQQPGTNYNLGNGWNTLAPNISGNYHDNYLVRAFISGPWYLYNTPDQSVYAECGSVAGSHQFQLSEKEAYLFSFSGKPPVGGFWSLTIYGSDDLLISNPLNRYSLGDRSNLTYADGASVYTQKATDSSSRQRSEENDGPFQILVQPADVIPPKNWTSNWLPSPSGGGSFLVTLRLYGPTDSILNGSYEYPVVSRQSAIV